MLPQIRLASKQEQAKGAAYPAFLKSAPENEIVKPLFDSAKLPQRKRTTGNVYQWGLVEPFVATTLPRWYTAEYE